MARQRSMPKVDAEMQRWSSALGDEIATWPQVTSRPMFGMMAFYRGANIFAALPRTRAIGTSSSLMVKLPDVQHDRLKAGRGPGAGWMTFEMTADEDFGEALRWLERAYKQARVKNAKKG
jgi:hypothetical protein